MKKVELRTIHVSDLKPYVNNARTHSEDQVRQIARNIMKFGFYNPILSDDEYNIIAGHGRLMAALLIGLNEVPVMVICPITDAERKTLALADNKISLNSSWDMDMVRSELLDLSDMDIDLELTGFNESELDSLIGDIADLHESDFEGNSENELNEDDYESSSQSENDDDGIVSFSIKMRKSNKDELNDVLNVIRQHNFYETQEESIMHLVRLFQEQ